MTKSSKLILLFCIVPLEQLKFTLDTLVMGGISSTDYSKQHSVILLLNMQELEEDPELRSKIAIYKDPNFVEQDRMTDGDDEEEELPDIPLEELLEDLTALQLQDEDTPQGS